MSVVTMRRKQKAKSCHSRCRRQSRPTRRPSAVMVARASGPMSLAVPFCWAKLDYYLGKQERRHPGPSFPPELRGQLRLGGIIAMPHSVSSLYISTSGRLLFVGIWAQVSRSTLDAHVQPASQRQAMSRFGAVYGRSGRVAYSFVTCASSQVIRLQTHPPLQLKRHAATGSDIYTKVMLSHGASDRAVEDSFPQNRISWSLHANP